MKKKVLYVGGANHSGSTMIGAVLGADNNDPFGKFHGGEIHAYFKKELPQYGDLQKAKNSPLGYVWNEIDQTVGYANAWEEIFRKLPNLNVVVDSSKTAHNLKLQYEAGVLKKFDVSCIVTYKPFHKIYESHRKRKHSDEKVVTNLKRYYSLITFMESIGIRYIVVDIEEFIRQPAEKTRVICDRLGIEYFPGKEQYWRFPSGHLYGASTQRAHVENPDSADYIYQSSEFSWLDKFGENIVDLEKILRDHAL